MARVFRPKLAEICAQTYDLCIVGGGINGAGAAREAALRGLRVLLVEERDFAFGASSRSTKLIHGGLRYLEQRDFALVAEALKERRALWKTLAPHLVRPLPFLIPHYEGDQRPAWLLRAGLWLYDWFAWRSRGLVAAHRWLSAAQARQLAPALNAAGLKGAALDYDCQMDDARLVLENIADASRLGARCLNYSAMLSAHKLADGDVRLRLRDLESDQEHELRAGLVVGAAGAWTDEFFERLGQPGAPRVKPTKGIHLVTRRLVEGHALFVPARQDKRLFFIVPWQMEGRPASLIGTTDTDFRGDKAHVRAESDEIDYLLQETRRVLPGERLAQSDIWATFAGLRPLTAPSSEGGQNSSLSREHAFHELPGVLAVTGGKFTTYRSLCAGLVERAAMRLGKALRQADSATLPLPGAPRDAREAAVLEVEGQRLRDHYGLSLAAAQLLVEHYGMQARDVAELTVEEPLLKQPIAPGTDCPAILAMAAWAAQAEGAVHLHDFYLRRTRLGYLLPPDHRGVDRVATVMGERLWWDRERETEELETLKRVVAGEYR